MADDPWTPALLKSHFDALLLVFEQRVNERFVTAEKATEIAQKAAEVALKAAQTTAAEVHAHLQSEIRNLAERQGRFEAVATTHVTQAEYLQAHRALEKMIADLREWSFEQRGRGMASSSIWAMIAGALALLITAAHAVISFLER